MRKKALTLLADLFGEKSQANFPVALIDSVLEIRQYVSEQLKQIDTK
jgi:hypothetical protein